MFAKKNKVSSEIALRKVGPIFEEYENNPKNKREKQLLNSLKRSQYSHYFLSFAVIAVGAFHYYKENSVVMVDSITKQIVGEYRQVAFRTSNEMIGGGMKFLDCFLSYSSESVYKDYACAMNMMNDDGRKARIKWLDETNLAKRVSNLNTDYYLKWDEKKLVVAKGQYAKLEFSGVLVIQYRDGNNGKETYAREDKQPFHFILDIEMIPLNPDNTTGIQINDWYEYEKM